MANPNPSPATRFKPGNRGGPGGKLRDPLTRAVREAMKAEDLKRVADMLWSFAMSGNLKAIEMLWDRLEGKAVARQEQGDPGAFDDLADVPSEELMRRLQEVRKLK
jgi:hypothetical protein